MKTKITRFIEQIEEAEIKACLRMPAEDLRARLFYWDRRIGKTESGMRFKCKILQRLAERHARLHIKRDRYSAGSKRGRRR